MINNFYNQGFGTEPEVTVYYMTSAGKEGYEIWSGYFFTFLDGCYHDKIVKGGILYGYMTQTEWCDESPWKIEDVRLAYHELKRFSEENMNPQMDCMSKELNDLQKKLLVFFEDALEKGKDVYLEYD